MRIVAGRFGGRRIEPPPSDATRPILDRVREALFSTLGEQVEGARVLDLCAGTGPCGLEALSRGASFVRFVERDAATRRTLQANVQTLGVAAESEVLGGDAFGPRAREAPERFVEEDAGELLEAVEAARWCDIAFVDPPYPQWKELSQRREILAALEDLYRTRLRAGGVIVLHAHPRDLAERELRFAAACEARDYNNSRLWYLR